MGSIVPRIDSSGVDEALTNLSEGSRLVLMCSSLYLVLRKQNSEIYAAGYPCGNGGATCFGYEGAGQDTYELLETSCESYEWYLEYASEINDVLSEHTIHIEAPNAQFVGRPVGLLEY